MKKIFRQWFGTATQADHHQHDSPATIEDGSDNAIRRHLVQILLRDLLRRHRVPLQWIEPQMLVVNSRSRGVGLLVRLILKHWDEQLMDHLYALQQALLSEINRFDPQSSQWLHGITWQLDLANTCPFRELPEKSFWSDSEHPLAAVASDRIGLQTADVAVHPVTQTGISQDDEDETLKDLEHLFMIRDQEINRKHNAA